MTALPASLELHIVETEAAPHESVEQQKVRAAQAGDMAMVTADLQERNVVCTSKRGVTNDNLRTKLERVLRGEGEWQGTIMYRRDQRFTIRDHDASHKAELDRTICNSALCDAS